MANDGKDAERAFLKYWNEKGAHVERFWDQRDLRGRNGGAKVADFPKPADFLVSHKDHPLHFAEVKSCEGKTSFPFGDIRDAQHVAAMKEHARGSGAYIFYIFSYHSGQWYTMDCHLYAAAHEAGKRSIKFEELTPWAR